MRAKVVQKGRSVNATAMKFSINWMTFTRFIKKLEPKGGVLSRQIVSTMEEDSLKKYLLPMAPIFYKYSPENCRCLAVKFGSKITDS